MKKESRLSQYYLLIAIGFIIISIPLVYMQLQEYLFNPDIKFATKDIVTYPMAEDKLISRKPQHIIGVLVENIGDKTAHDLLIRFPSNMPYVGWMATGSIKGQTKMDFKRGTYKFPFFSAGESVSFYIYMNPYSDSFIDKIKVNYDGGKVERYAYEAFPINYKDRMCFPFWYKWLLIALLFVLVILIIIEKIWPKSPLVTYLKNN